MIDETCGLTGNDLLVGEGPEDDVRVVFVGAYCRGQRREDEERDYLENYHPTDERVPRFRQLPDSRLVHVRDLLTTDELKTSPTYNELLRRAGGQDSLNVRLDGPDGSSITWGLRNPVDSTGSGASRVGMVTALLPHVRQFVGVRQALVRAEARHTTVTALLDNHRIGVVHLDRRGRIMEANDRARDILRARRRAVGPRRGATGARAGRPGPSGAVGGRRAAGLRHGRGLRVDAAPALARAAAVRVVRQARGHRSTRLRSASRRGAGADCRAGAPTSRRSGHGGQDPGVDGAQTSDYRAGAGPQALTC